MITHKNLKEQLDKIDARLNTLNPEIIEQARKYRELKDLLSHIRINVDKAFLFLNNGGQFGVEVNYSVSPIKIYFDGDGSVIKNNRFYAMNYLNLISTEDFKKINVILEEAQRKNKV